MHEDVTYFSDGLRIAAYLYRPKDWKPGDPPRPAIVCLTGYSGRKDVATIDVPERLAEEEYYFILAPDYRGSGKSEGERGRHRPLEQAQDTYDAITFLETLEGVDPERIGLYGTSFGGANAIWAAAFDERVKVVVSAVGVHDGERWLHSVRSAYDWLKFREEVRAAARERVRTGQKTMISVIGISVGDPDKPKPPFRAEEHGYEEVREYDLESAEACFRYKPEWVVGKISPRPVLFIYGEHDVHVPPQETLSCFAACGNPKKLVKLPKARHNDIYRAVNPEIFEKAALETIAWFKEHL